MRGDKLVIQPHHTERAGEICQLLSDRALDRFVLTVAGESGSGKSELAAEIARLLTEVGAPTGVLQQDDYFVFPPKTNHEMRRQNIKQVGPYEVKLDFLDSNLRSFKRGESPIYKPLVDYEADSITTEEIAVADFQVMVAEGTYTSLLTFVDLRIFIDRDFRDTEKHRKRRARDTFEPFVEDVLKIEHDIIAEHKGRANIVIAKKFDKILVQNID
jgi:uridine kinase